MTAIDMNTLKELRNKTQAPLKDCKEALEEANGDLQRAHEVLKEKGALKAAKKADRETKEGIVVVKNINNKVVSLILACETDFVAKNDTFKTLANDIVAMVGNAVAQADDYEAMSQEVKDTVKKMLDDNQLTIGENMQIATLSVTPVSKNVYIYTHPGDKIAAVVQYEGDEQSAKNIALQGAAMNPVYFSADEIPAEELEAMKAQYRQELEGSTKPADIQEKIIEGRLHKELAEVVLLEQMSIVDDTKKVKDTLGGTTILGYSRYAV